MMTNCDTVDAVARLMAQWLSDRFGQQFGGENPHRLRRKHRGRCAINSPPDGYTAAVRRAEQRDLDLALQKLPYEFIRDTVPVASIMQLTNMLVVSNATPAKTVQEFHRLLQGQSGKISFASSWQRHFRAHVGRTVKVMTKCDMVACALSRIGDRVSRHHLQQGAVDLRQPASRWSRRAAAPCARSASPRRSAGRRARRSRDRGTVPGFESVGFYGISAPKGTPPEIVETLTRPSATP